MSGFNRKNRVSLADFQNGFPQTETLPRVVRASPPHGRKLPTRRPTVQAGPSDGPASSDDAGSLVAPTPPIDEDYEVTTISPKSRNGWCRPPNGQAGPAALELPISPKSPNKLSFDFNVINGVPYPAEWPGWMEYPHDLSDRKDIPATTPESDDKVDWFEDDDIVDLNPEDDFSGPSGGVSTWRYSAWTAVYHTRATLRAKFRSVWDSMVGTSPEASPEASSEAS